MRCQINTENLKVAYGDFVALDCGTAEFSGNIIALLGHNGAGKSTFIKAMLELLPAYQGNLRIQLQRGAETLALTPEDHMAFCPESGSVFEDITVEDYVRLWCRIKRKDAKYYCKGGSSVLDMLDLSPLLKKLGRELSKGQRRRVQTAIGYLTNPLVFLFDEPFDGLDVQKTSELADIMRARSHEMCAVISSHRMDVVERLADFVIVLQDGKVAACGSVDSAAEQLCKQSFLLKNFSDLEAVVSLLKEHLPGSIICRLGEQITLSGEGLEVAEIKKILQAKNEGRVEVAAIRPSLTDAMNYHLSKIK